MSRNCFETMRDDAIRAAGFLKDNFHYAPIDTSVYEGTIHQMKTLGGAYSLDMKHNDGDRHVISALAGMSSLGVGLHTRGKKRDDAQIMTGWLQTDQILAAHARLAVMGFGDDGFKQLREHFGDYLEEIRTAKHGRVIPWGLRLAVWFDAVRDRGEYFITPTVRESDCEFTVNDDKTRGMFVGKRTDGYTVLVFAPLTIKHEAMSNLLRAAELTEVDRSCAYREFSHAIWMASREVTA